MSEFKVELGVPLATRGHGNGRTPFKYPWVDMQSGDSFEVPADNGDRWRVEKTLRAAGSSFLMRHRPPGWLVRVRYTESGVRVWLFAPGEAP